MKEVPPHHQPVTLHLETGSIGELGASWYAFIRGILRASDEIDQRRAAHSQGKSSSLEEPSEIEGKASA